ncbi:MAG TPA: monovalent cation/H+ antiporter subunit D family protein [Candidatus Krumholzibacteria bacterium]|nr:monovalent cation/H+ antiporter subunit D family protein [Candidatus Krumholzibacteria bacterium]
MESVLLSLAAEVSRAPRDAAQAFGPTMDHQAPALGLLVVMVGAFLVAALGYWKRRLAYPATLLTLLTFLGTAIYGLERVLTLGPLHYRMAGWEPPVGIELNLDALSAFVITMIALVSLLVCVYAGTAVRRENPERESTFYGMLLVMLLGLTGMVITADLFNLYVWFEVSSLAGYALMAVGHKKAPVSAFRYLLLGTLGASFYLLGVGYLYVLTGSLNMFDVAGRLGELQSNPALWISVVFMVGGLGLKMALFPMHLWLPDAYTYASSTSTAIIAPLMTKVSAYVMIRVLYFVYGHEWSLHGAGGLGPAITWMALAGIVVGSVMAIAQKDAKRMLAYSSIAQVGYIGVGIGLATPLALVGAMLHILNHAIMKSCLFLVTGSVQLQADTVRLRDYTGLGRRMPWTFAAFTLAALAMVGVPPTNGFFSKWYLVLGGIAAGQWVVVVLILASSLLTAVYFFRVLERIYARPAPEGEDGAPVTAVVDPPLSMRAPVLVLGVGVLALGLANAWLVSTILRLALPADLPWPL